MIMSFGRGTFFQASGIRKISLVEVYKRVGKSVIAVCGGTQKGNRPFYGCEKGKKTSWFRDLFMFTDVFTAVKGMQRSKLVCERGNLFCQKWYITGRRLDLEVRN